MLPLMRIRVSVLMLRSLGIPWIPLFFLWIVQPDPTWSLPISSYEGWSPKFEPYTHRISPWIPSVASLILQIWRSSRPSRKPSGNPWKNWKGIQPSTLTLLQFWVCSFWSFGCLPTFEDWRVGLRWFFGTNCWTNRRAKWSTYLGV